MCLLGFYTFFYVRGPISLQLLENIGYGCSYLEFLGRHFKVFRLDALLHAAAGAVLPDIGKELCY